MQEVSLHNKLDDYWCIIDGLVFDLTQFLAYHPGGSPYLIFYFFKLINNVLIGIKIMAPFSCKDITGPFQHYHAWVNYHMLLQSCLLGSLET